MNVTNKWTLQEIAKLKEKYPKADLDELSKELNRSVRAIVCKAHKLKILRQYNNSVVDGKKFCSYCNKWHSIEQFYRNKALCNGYEYYCKKYYNTKGEKAKAKLTHSCNKSLHSNYKGANRERVVHSKAKVLILNGIEGKICSECREWKPLGDYSKQATGIGGRTAKCKACHMKVYFGKENFKSKKNKNANKE